MTKNQKRRAKFLSYASIATLTVYIIADHDFAIYDSSVSLFINSFILLLASMGLSFIVQVIIHELGHLVFGLFSSYEFSSFRLFSFLFIKREGKIKLERLDVPGTAGQCLMKPKSTNLGLRSAFIYNLGGGIFNILVSLFLVFVHFRYLIHTNLSIYSRAFYSLGVFVAFTNLVPIKTGPIPNDGYNCLLMYQDPKSVKVFNEILLIQDYITENTLYEDIPQNLLYFNDDYDYNSPTYTGSLAFYHASLLDKEAYQEASDLNKLVLDKYRDMIPHYKDYFKFNLLFFDILGLDNLDFIKKRYTLDQRFIEASRNSLLLFRIQYAYYSLIAKNIEQAKNAERKFYHFLKLDPYKSDIKIEKQLMDLVDHKLDELSKIYKEN